MIILINHLPAALKEGSSFDFISENRYFTGSDSYTLAITFPLRDCPQNIAIFGHIHRKDIEKSTILFDCEIRDKSFYKAGSLTITEISDTEVKCQFLEGRSKLNYQSSFDDIYLNELTINITSALSSSSDNGGGSRRVAESAESTEDTSLTYVSLPWVNNYSGNLQNKPSETTKISYQPYLLYLVKKILAGLRYTYDLTAWENSTQKYLLCTNALPYAWGLTNYARALPHWTLTEFFEQLEYFLNGEFTFDHVHKTCTYQLSSAVIQNAGSVELNTVLNDYSVTVDTDASSDYRESVQLKYAECDHRMWKYWSCQWAIDNMKAKGKYREFTDLAAMKSLFTYLDTHGTRLDMETYFSEPSAVLYAKAEDAYFVISTSSGYNKAVGTRENYVIESNYTAQLVQVNLFPDNIPDENADTIEIKIVPTWIDEAYDSSSGEAVSLGNCIFLDLPEYDEDNTTRTYLAYEAYNLITEGEENTADEFLDKIYVAYWDGNNIAASTGSSLQCPIISNVVLNNGKSTELAYTITGYSLTLRQENSLGYQETYKINPVDKFTFKWIADTIPNVRALFFIHGKRYVCAKITATFTEDGMSQLLKGEFYEVVD